MSLTIGILLCIIMVVVGSVWEPKILNPITIFFMEWFIVLYLSKLNLFNIIEVSDKTYTLIFIGMCMYILGFYGYSFFSQKSRLDSKKTYVLNSKVVYILAIVTMIFFFFDFSKSIVSLVSGGSLATLRESAQNGSLFSENKVLNAIRILIAAPFSLALSAIAPANFFFNKKSKNKRLLIITIIIMLERLLSDGGRSPIIYLMMSFVICYTFSLSNGHRIKKKFFIRNGKIKIPNKHIYISIAVLASIWLMYIITLSRSGENTIRYSYYYFAMEPVMFEKWGNIVDNNNLIACGMASFNGILFTLFYLISSIFGVAYPTTWRTIYNVIEGLGTQWQTITYSGLQANSYASIFWTFYFDGRTIGIIVGMLLYGVFVATIYRNSLNRPTEKNVALYSFTLIGVFYTFQQLIFQNIYYSIAFLMIIFLLYKSEKKL